MRTTTSRSVLASATGALALSLLLAGCTSGGSDETGDAPAESASAASPESSASPTEAAEKEGTVRMPASCDEAGAALGELVTGLTLDATSSVEGTEANCSWSDGADAASSTTRVLLLVEEEPLDDAETDDLASSTIPGGTVTEADDERVAAFDGRAFLVDYDGTSAAGRQGLGSAAFVAAPQGAVAVAELTTDGTAPAGTDVVLDTVLEFVD